MATVTDIIGNKNEEVDDESSISSISDLGGDSVNISDEVGNSISGGDVLVNNVLSYDNDFIYSDMLRTYNGTILQGVVVDISGS